MPPTFQKGFNENDTTMLIPLYVKTNLQAPSFDAYMKLFTGNVW